MIGGGAASIDQPIFSIKNQPFCQSVNAGALSLALKGRCAVIRQPSRPLAEAHMAPVAPKRLPTKLATPSARSSCRAATKDW